MIAASPSAPLYQHRRVASLLADTAQLTSCAPANGFACYRVKGTDIDGYVNPGIEDDGYLSNGQEVLIVPLVSGGSGGIFDSLLYTRTGSVPFRFVGYVPSESGHLLIYINGGQLIVQTPTYKPDDPQCCPSGHEWKAYTLDGIHMRQVTAW